MDATQSKVTVIGQATDDSGVAEVWVNKRPAELAADGTFVAEIFLKPGENPIRVKAIDINGNAQELETLTIYRSESRKLEGPETPDPSPPPAIALFSPEGRYLALFTTDGPVFCRTADGKEVYRQREAGAVIAFTLDGRFVACRGHEHVWLHDLDKGRPLGAPLKVRKTSGTSQMAFVHERYLAVTTQEAATTRPTSGGPRPRR